MFIVQDHHNLSKF